MKKTRPNFCNILSLGDRRHFWQFTTGSSRTQLAHELNGADSSPLPARWAAKDWRSLYQPKLNIAWLPAEQVFLRVTHLPSSDPAELQSMVELQLEKLSPLPVAQIVWSFESVNEPVEGMQTVIVIIVARSVVEQFLGQLEGHGYLADRLEVPFLHQLLATPIEGDGVWIFPRTEASGRTTCLLAWWYGGILRDLGLVHLPDAETFGALLTEQITKMAWAGELEGWLTAPPRWHLAVEPDQEQTWLESLVQQTGENIQVIEPLPPTKLAEISAHKAAAAESRANLLPGEYAARYRQRFIDGLWMKGLLALVGVYLAGVLIYFAVLEVVKFRQGGIASVVESRKAEYTKALQLKARSQILQEQFALKYAALDSWKLASMHLPAELTLTSFDFDKGKTVTLFGTASAEAVAKITDYNEALAKATLDESGGQPFFSVVNPPRSQQRQNGVAWSFTCEIRRTETQ